MMNNAIEIGNTTLRLVRGDITEQSVDAIVNAANSSLLGGGGVDGAIHKAGGPSILEECQAIRAAQGGCIPGEAVITTAGALPAQKVIHTVGPVWSGGARGENFTLERAYTNSLALARREGLRSVAFPSISTGAYKFPTAQAALIAINTLVREIKASPEAFDEVSMVLFSDTDHQIYAKALTEVEDTMLG